MAATAGNMPVCADCSHPTATTADNGFVRVPYCRRCFAAKHAITGPGAGHRCNGGCGGMLLPPPGGGDPLLERCATCDAVAVAALRAAGWRDVVLQNSSHAVVRGQVHPGHQLGSGHRMTALHLIGAADYDCRHALARLWAMGTSATVGADSVTDVRPVVRAENELCETAAMVRVFIDTRL